jgi:hypothetical protein
VTTHPVRDDRQNRVVFLAFPPCPAYLRLFPRGRGTRSRHACLLKKGLQLGRVGVLVARCRQQPSARPHKSAGVLTILTEKEPVTKVTFEVLERGVAHEVEVLTVLQRAVGPAGAVEGVVLHCDDVHNGGNEVPSEDSLGYLHPPVRRNRRKHINKESQVTVPNHVTLHIQTYRRGRRGGTNQVAAVEGVKRALVSRP